MAHVNKWLTAFLIIVAVWLSDDAVWILPGLLGVTLGVALAGGARARNLQAGQAHSLASLLIFVGFLYVYMAFVLLQFRRTLEMLALWERPERPVTALLIGSVVVSCLLAIVGAGLILRLPVPPWLRRAWRHLLMPR